MSSKPLLAANDNGKTPQIRVMIVETQPLNMIEVEIFDALISNTGELTANDNEPPGEKEKER